MIKRAAEAGHLFFLGPFVRMPRLLASSRGAVSAAAAASRERGAGRASRAGWGACAAWRYAFLSAFSPTRSSRGRRSVRSAFCTAWLQAAAALAQASCPGSAARGAPRSVQHPRRRAASTLPRCRAPRVIRASSVALHARHGCHEGVTRASRAPYTPPGRAPAPCSEFWKRARSRSKCARRCCSRCSYLGRGPPHQPGHLGSTKGRSHARPRILACGVRAALSVEVVPEAVEAVPLALPPALAVAPALARLPPALVHELVEGALERLGVEAPSAAVQARR